MFTMAISVNEATKVIGISRSLIYKLISTGQLPIIKLGTRTLVPVKSLEAFIAAKTVISGGAE